LASIVQGAVAIVCIVALAAVYLLVQFRGLSSEVGIDQAQVAKQLAHGYGFTTKNFRILALQQLQNRKGHLALERLPDSYNAPLNPMVNAIALRVFSAALSKRANSTDPVFAGDKLIAAVSIVFFLAGVAISFF
jgi:hypothetical protein